jgi:hypothetical protein
MTSYRHKKLLGINSGIMFCGINKNIQDNNSSLEIVYFGFPFSYNDHMG